MFGYVRPLVGELKVSEYEYYKSVYCGVCCNMGNECGAVSRLCLSYDLTFLALLQSAVKGENARPQRGRCPVNPLLKKPMVLDSESVCYAAAACGVLAAYGFRDDKNDESGLGRAVAGIGTSVSEKWLKKVKKRYPGLCEGIEERLAKVYEAEKAAKLLTAEEISIDSLAQTFGDVLAFVFSYPVSGSWFDGDETVTEHCRAICSNIGHHTGRWIYCIDAIDDIKKDAEKHRFNPFLIAYGKSEFTEDEKLTLGSLLSSESKEAADALDLCEFFQNAATEPMNITRNILNLGMPDTARKVIEAEYRKPEHGKI